MNKKQMPFIRSMVAAMMTSSMMHSSTMGLGFAETPKPKIITKYDKEAIRKAEEKRKRKGKP
jgi:hypothetical protein